MTDERPVEVLLAGSDPEYLEQVASRVTEDGVQVHTVATTDPEAAIARLDDGSVDCLIATYNPSANEGLPVLDYLRDDSIDVPVILLPSGPTTVVVSENLVVDVASVFTREEALKAEGDNALGPDVVVNAVEERQATEAAQRRRGLEQAIESVARELSEAEHPTEVDRSLVDGMTDTDEIDGAWMTDVDGEEVSVRDAADADIDAPAPDDGPTADAVRRALATEQPQVTHRDGVNYAAVPVSPENGESGVLTMASESRYAFSDEETRVLRDVGDTASRAIDDVTRRQVAPGDVEGQQAFETVLERLNVPVVAYGDAGWIAGANESFADLVDAGRDDVVGQPVWDVLPSPNLDTFEDYWASFSAGETRTQLVELAGLDTPRQLVTTRVAVGDEEYNVSLAVEQVDESADPWFADVLAYEFRHWLAIAEDAMEGEDDEDEEVIDAVVDRMQDAMESEVQAAAATGGSASEDIVLDEPAEAVSPDSTASAEAAADAAEAELELELDAEAEAVDADTVTADTIEAETVEADAVESETMEAAEAVEEADSLDFGEADGMRMDQSSLAEAAATDDGLTMEPQPVSGMARDAWMTVVGDFGEYEIRGKRKVLADETLLHRLFAHLFRTLFSYGKASGVDVGVEDDGFFVADDGTGVPHHERAYAETESMTDAKSGAGIQVARRLAERHGWDLHIEPTDDGGTRFSVSGADIRNK